MKRILSFALAFLIFCSLASCQENHSLNIEDTLFGESAEDVELLEDSTDKAYMRNGNKILLGYYPQSEVADDMLRERLCNIAGELPTSSNPQSWTSYGYYISGSVSDYMWYIDVEDGSDRYRGVYFTSYRPYYTTSSSSAENTYQDDNGYLINSVYWFKYEPISWTLLSENKSDGTAFIYCDMIIDSREYYITDGSIRNINGEAIYPNNYANSTIREWLNECFFDIAFDDREKEIILASTVENRDESTGYGNNPYACENTCDKVLLLSYGEAIKSNYGLNSTQFRQKVSTDYARAQGVYTDTSSRYVGNSQWWLRSPYIPYMMGFSCYVNYQGIGVYRSVNSTDLGIAPALNIIL